MANFFLIDENDIKVKCVAPNCDKTFAYMRSMQGHLKQFHGLSYAEMLKSGDVNSQPKITEKGEEDPFKTDLTESEPFDSNLIKVVCEICFESFDSKAACDQHYQEQHTNDNNEEDEEMEIDSKTEISPCDIKEDLIVKEEPMD